LILLDDSEINYGSFVHTPVPSQKLRKKNTVKKTRKKE
jgi:hypothetical protein